MPMKQINFSNPKILLTLFVLVVGGILMILFFNSGLNLNELINAYETD